MSKLATSSFNLSVIFFTIQGILSCIFKTGSTIDNCASCAAFFASIIFPVLFNTSPNTSLYCLCKLLFNSGAKLSREEPTISLIIPFDAETISSAPSNIPLNVFLNVAELTVCNVFSRVVFILLNAFEFVSSPCPPPANIIFVPMALYA